MDTKDSSTSIAEKRRSVRKIYRQNYIRRIFYYRMRNIKTKIIFYLRITGLPRFSNWKSAWSTTSIWLEQCRNEEKRSTIFLEAGPWCSASESFSLLRQYSMQQATNWLKAFIIYTSWWMDRKPVALLHTFTTKMGVYSYGGDQKWWMGIHSTHNYYDL